MFVTLYPYLPMPVHPYNQDGFYYSLYGSGPVVTTSRQTKLGVYYFQLALLSPCLGIITPLSDKCALHKLGH